MQFFITITYSVQLFNLRTARVPTVNKKISI